MRGALADGINSLHRYYLNNFVDGHNQDSLDLFHGRYAPDRTLPSPFVKQPSLVCDLWLVTCACPHVLPLLSVSILLFL